MPSITRVSPSNSSGQPIASPSFDKQFMTLGAIGADQTGQPQGHQDDETGGGVDPERLELCQAGRQKVQDVCNQRQQDNAGESANHAPATTFEGNSPNDGSRKD